jgi:hypothetical protein
MISGTKIPVASPPVAKQNSVPAPEGLQQNRSVSLGYKCKQFVSGQNVESSSNGSTADGAVLEEAKILAITKIVLNLMEQNGH